MKTASLKQIEANKRNAQFGGVKTEEGKQITRFNALKHGILRSSISEYEQIDFETLYRTLWDDFPPKNSLEEIVLERIAVSYIKMLRVSKAEADYIKESVSPRELLIFPDHSYQAVFSAGNFEQLTKIFARYETSAENRFYKAIEKLLELQKLTVGKE